MWKEMTQVSKRMHQTPQGVSISYDFLLHEHCIYPSLNTTINVHIICTYINILLYINIPQNSLLAACTVVSASYIRHTHLLLLIYNTHTYIYVYKVQLMWRHIQLQSLFWAVHVNNRNTITVTSFECL